MPHCCYGKCEWLFTKIIRRIDFCAFSLWLGLMEQIYSYEFFA